MGQFLNTLFQAVIAIGSIFILIQLYYFRRTAKAEACHRIYATFIASKKLIEFRRSVGNALEITDEINSFRNELLSGNLKFKGAEENIAFLSVKAKIRSDSYPF